MNKHKMTLVNDDATGRGEVESDRIVCNPVAQAVGRRRGVCAITCMKNVHEFCRCVLKKTKKSQMKPRDEDRGC